MLKSLTKKQKVLLVVGVVFVLSSGVVGAIFGHKKHAESKALPATDTAVDTAE